MRSKPQPPETVGHEALRLRSGAPVLARGPGEAQVGLARPLVLEGLSDDDQVFLASLEGRRVALSQAERERHGSIVESLSRHGLLEPIPSPIPVRGIIRIRGVDPVTSWLAIGLAFSGVSALSIVGSRTSLEAPRAWGFPENGDVDSLLRLLKDSRPGMRLATPEEDASLEVLRSHGAPDIVHARRLTSRDIPHLDVVSDEEGVTVGPLVVPGRTACETCLGIVRTETDPWWARIALQLGDSRRNAGLVVPARAALLAASLALWEILSHLEGGRPTSTRWRVPFDVPLPDAEVGLPHPSCGCGASVGPEPAAGARPPTGVRCANRGARRRAS